MPKPPQIPKIQVVNATGLPLTVREVYDPATGVLTVYINQGGAMNEAVTPHEGDVIIENVGTSFQVCVIEDGISVLKRHVGPDNGVRAERRACLDAHKLGARVLRKTNSGYALVDCTTYEPEFDRPE